MFEWDFEELDSWLSDSDIGEDINGFIEKKGELLKQKNKKISL
jgi:hypothetical protein